MGQSSSQVHAIRKQTPFKSTYPVLLIVSCNNEWTSLNVGIQILKNLRRRESKFDLDQSKRTQDLAKGIRKRTQVFNFRLLASSFCLDFRGDTQILSSFRVQRQSHRHAKKRDPGKELGERSGN